MSGNAGMATAEPKPSESGEPLERASVTGEIGNRDIQLNAAAPIIHATVEPLRRRDPESQQRYYDEKIAELVLTQSQLGKAIAERDALAKELREIRRIGQTYNQPERKDSWKWLNEIGDIAAKVLEKLASGDLRKLAA